jgi:hypothetical protein
LSSRTPKKVACLRCPSGVHSRIPILRDRYVQVSYQERGCQIKGILVQETVLLEVTSCGYSGKQYWFRCPTCNRRAGTLFLASRPFGCRVCMRLAYESQRESAADRDRRPAMRHLSTGREGALDSSLSDEDLEGVEIDEPFEEDDLEDAFPSELRSQAAVVRSSLG